MTEPVWQRTGKRINLLMPVYPYVHRTYAGHITRHTRKHTYFVHRGMNKPQVFHDLDEAKTWLMAIAKLEN